MKVLAFGEIMMRLGAIGETPIVESAMFDACYGGTEANVLACLNKFGHGVKYLTGLPENELGKAVLKHLAQFNIDTGDVSIKGDTLGLYFVENGSGSRGASVIYMRKHSSFASLDENAFDFDKVFDGIDLFHISGISFALSESSRALAFRLMKEAKARGILVSFDFNYRAKLWTTGKAAEQFVKAVEYADIVLASDLDLSVFLKMSVQQFFAKYSAKYLVLRNRRVLSSTKHAVSVAIYHNNYNEIEEFESNDIAFDVVEKIGGGDAFDGGILHGILSGMSIDDTIKFAVSAFILKHSVKGDTFTLTEKDVLDYIREKGDEIV